LSGDTWRHDACERRIFEPVGTSCFVLLKNNVLQLARKTKKNEEQKPKVKRKLANPDQK